jgi:hypothetical protein
VARSVGIATYPLGTDAPVRAVQAVVDTPLEDPR